MNAYCLTVSKSLQGNFPPRSIQNKTRRCQEKLSVFTDFKALPLMTRWALLEGVRKTHLFIYFFADREDNGEGFGDEGEGGRDAIAESDGIAIV